MIPYLSERENSIQHIDALCMRLFDTWCDTRSVKPLAHLLKVWPLRNSEPATIRGLNDVLRNLRNQHPNALTVEMTDILLELADCLEELLD
jgi:hypothetical protein